MVAAAVGLRCVLRDEVCAVEATKASPIHYTDMSAIQFLVDTIKALGSHGLRKSWRTRPCHRLTSRQRPGIAVMMDRYRHSNGSTEDLSATTLLWYDDHLDHRLQASSIRCQSFFILLYAAVVVGLSI